MEKCRFCALCLSMSYDGELRVFRKILRQKMLVKILIVLIPFLVETLKKVEGSSLEETSIENAMVSMVNTFHATTTEPRHISCDRDPTHWAFLMSAVSASIIMTAVTMILHCVTFTVLYRKNHKVV